jgi:hypothetical protein
LRRANLQEAARIQAFRHALEVGVLFDLDLMSSN